jgi:positive regulator of sigma E activity
MRLYGLEWIPGVGVVGAVLVLLIVPPFALIALAVVALAVAAALVALVGVILATPYLVVRTIRRRFADRHIRQPQPLPVGAAVTEIAPFRAELSGPQVG